MFHVHNDTVMKFIHILHFQAHACRPGICRIDPIRLLAGWHKRRPEPGLVLLGLVLRMFVVSLIVVFVFVLSLGCSYICVASVGRLIR